MKNKSFPSSAWHHIYSITRDGGVLFYRITDRLCFFSIMSIYAHSYHMIVLGLSIMFTHFHMMVRAVDTAHIRAFVGQCLATFTRIINDDRTLSVLSSSDPLDALRASWTKRSGPA